MALVYSVPGVAASPGPEAGLIITEKLVSLFKETLQTSQSLIRVVV